MSRRKNRGDASPVPFLFGMIIVAALVAIGAIAYYAWQERAKINAQPVVTTPTQPVTPPEATKPKEDPKPEEKPKAQPNPSPDSGGKDGAEKPVPPKNPCSWLFAEAKKGMTAKEFDALYERANIDGELDSASVPGGWKSYIRRITWREWKGNMPNESSEPKWVVAIEVWFDDDKVTMVLCQQWQQQNWSEEVAK